MAFNPNNYIAPKKTRRELILEEHGYKEIIHGSKAGEYIIMIHPANVSHNEAVERDLIIYSDPGEGYKQFFTRLGWL